MSDQIIDIVEVAMPGPTGDVTPEALQVLSDTEGVRDQAITARNESRSARDESEEWRDQAEAFAAGAQARGGVDVIMIAGQSLAGGTQAVYDPAIDDDFEGIYYWGVNSTDPNYHDIAPVTALPIQGLLSASSYGLPGGIIAARLAYRETQVPQVVIPAYVGGSGFYNSTVQPGRWLVSETEYPNLATLSLAELNLAIAHIVGNVGPVRSVSVIWNQGEADRNVTTSEIDYASALDELIEYWRAGVSIVDGDSLPVVVSRQLPERRDADGALKAGVDLAQMGTPGRIPFTSVMNPPSGYAASDGTHALVKGQRIMGRLYHEEMQRAAFNRPSLPSMPPMIDRIKRVGATAIVSWTIPAGGRFESVSLRWRLAGGAWQPTVTLLAGERDYEIVGVPRTSGVEVELRTMSSAASSEAAYQYSAPVVPQLLPFLSFDPALALGLRKLTVSADKCVRVRRAADGAESDIGFDMIGELDLGALLTFADGGDLSVATFYDQSPAARHMTQGDPLKQPSLVVGGVVNRDGNGSPSALFSGNRSILTTSSVFMATAPGLSSFAVVDGGGPGQRVVVETRTTTIGVALSPIRSNTAQNRLSFHVSTNEWSDHVGGDLPAPFTPGTPHLACTVYDKETVKFFVDDNALPEHPITLGEFVGMHAVTVGGMTRQVGDTNWYEGYLRELVIYPVALTEEARAMVAASMFG